MSSKGYPLISIAYNYLNIAKKIQIAIINNEFFIKKMSKFKKDFLIKWENDFKTLKEIIDSVFVPVEEETVAGEG